MMNAEITIDTTSINSGTAPFDKHLKSAEILKTEAFPTAKFVGDKFSFNGDKVTEVAGTLTLAGKTNPVTLKASEVLQHGTGFCYAKSHLLAALLRANGIPAGLCYQRLSVNDTGAPWCLHGLNAVFLEDIGWYRCDARGNRPGVTAAFTPPVERLAFAVR